MSNDNRLQAGQKAPKFTAKADDGKPLSLDDFAGKYLVLYFYPKDDTPGCTKEACAFRDELPNFEGLNAEIVGVSKDSVEKHQKFKQKYDLNFPLLADTEGEICEAYGVFREKMNFGKTSLGIVRSTFLIGPDGVVVRAWNSVKVAGHDAQVKKALEAAQQAAA